MLSSSREHYWQLIHKYQFEIKWLILLKPTSASQTILSIQIFVHLMEAISTPTCLLLRLPERNNSDSTTSFGLFLFHLSQSTGKLGWCCRFGRARKSCRCTVTAPRLKFTNLCWTQTAPVFPLRWNCVFNPAMVQMQTALAFRLMFGKIVCKFARYLWSRKLAQNILLLSSKRILYNPSSREVYCILFYFALLCAAEVGSVERRIVTTVPPIMTVLHSSFIVNTLAC